MTVTEIRKELDNAPENLKGIELQKYIHEIGARALQRSREAVKEVTELVGVFEVWEDLR